MKKSPVIYNDKCFTTSPFRQDRPKFHAYIICVLAIDPFLTLRVVFPAYRNILLCVRCVKANVYLANLQELKLGSGVKWNGNNKDVAKRANVSTTTVSHVINKTRFVAEETRNAVWAAIKELHYSPSAVARSLKVNHTKSIGLLATSSEAAYFAEIIEAVEKIASRKVTP